LARLEGGTTFDLQLRRLEVDTELLAELTPHLERQWLHFYGATFMGKVDFSDLTFTKHAGFRRAIFAEEADFRGATFNARADFGEATFKGGVMFTSATFNERAEFRKAVFSGLDGEGNCATFAHTNFAGDSNLVGTDDFPVTDFRESVFTGNALFPDAIFSDSAFVKTTFSDIALFGGAKFSRDARFGDTTFNEDAWFWGVTFTHDVNFGGATFVHGAQFGGATFKEKADFSNAAFADTVDFTPLDGSEDTSVVELARAKFTGPTRVSLGRPLSLTQVIVQAPLTIVATGPKAAVASLERATLEAPVVLDEGVRLTRCILSGATGLDRLRIPGFPGWIRYVGSALGGLVFSGRQVIADELLFRAMFFGDKRAHSLVDKLEIDTSVLPDNPRTIEAVYRQLRASLEASKAAPAAADFYYGEMEMRRLSTEQPFESMLLWLYKVTCGYGLRASRALATYAIVLLSFTFLFRYLTSSFVNSQKAAAGGGEHPLSFQRFWDVAAILIRSSVSFLSPITSGLTALGTLMLVALRFSAPVALALAILAVRARVQR
jgi:uncharacterized protein YjbI with pentapeptide repeats